MHLIPGQGTKKPLNMLEAPIYPDIKQALPEFKWSKKYWTVDVGQTLLDTEANTQIYGDAVLTRSYRDNIDSYGQSSHQEKITVFRPPLQNSYEDFGPLNRLPVKLHAIVPHINPGTTNDAGGTNAYSANNMINQEPDRHITDKKSQESSWFSTYYGPIDTSMDNMVLPDLETTMPAYSLYSGYQTQAWMDAENPKSRLVLDKPNLPTSPVHASFSIPFSANVETRLNDLVLEPVIPSHSVTAGINNPRLVDGVSRLGDMELTRLLPTTPISAGFKSNVSYDGETRLDDIQLNEQLTSKLSVINPSSESGYQTRMESYTSPENYIKLRQNPNVPAYSGATFGYRDQNYRTNIPKFQGKLEPIKNYGSSLNSGTIKTAGLEEPKVGDRYFGNRKTQKVY